MSGRIVDLGDNCASMSHPTDVSMSKRVNSSRWIRTVLALGGSTLYLMEIVAQALQTPIAEPLGLIRRFLRSVLDQQRRGIDENVLNVYAKSSQILPEPSKLKDIEDSRRTTGSETTEQVKNFSTETTASTEATNSENSKPVKNFSTETTASTEATNSENSKPVKNFSTETTKVETPFVLEPKTPMEVEDREDKLDDSLEECNVEDLILEGHDSLDSIGFNEEETDVSGADIMEIVLHDLTKTIVDEIETDSKQVEVLAKILKTEGYLPELAVGDNFPSEDTGIIQEEILRKTTLSSQENFKSIPVEQIVPQKRMEPIVEEEGSNHSLTEDYVENQDLEVDKSAEYEDFEKEVNISDVVVEEIVPQLDYHSESTDNSNQEDVLDISNREEFKFAANEVKWNKSRVEVDKFSKNDNLSGSCFGANKYTGIFAEASRDESSLVLDESDILAPPAPASASIGRLPGFQHLYMYEPYKKRYDAYYTQPNNEYDEYEMGYIVDRVNTTYSELSKKFNKSHVEIFEKLNTSFTESYEKREDSEGQLDTLDDSVGHIENDLEGQIDSLVDDLIGEALQQASFGDKTLAAEKYEKRLHPVELIDSLLDDLIGGVVELSPSGTKNHVGVDEELSLSGTKNLIGGVVELSTSGAKNHVGVDEELSPSGAKNLIGGVVELSPSGAKNHVGANEELSPSGAKNHVGANEELSLSGTKNHVGVNEDFVDFLLSDDSFDSSFEMNEF